MKTVCVPPGILYSAFGRARAHGLPVLLQGRMKPSREVALKPEVKVSQSIDLMQGLKQQGFEVKKSFAKISCLQIAKDRTGLNANKPAAQAVGTHN